MSYSVIDKRSWPTKTALWLWGKWSNPNLIIKYFSKLTSQINKYFISKRVQGRSEIEANPIVVSVGNIALGGTGKTPIVVNIASEIINANYSVAIITRGYRSISSKAFVVDAANIAAGDEARMMAKLLPNVIIVQAKDKLDGYNLIKDKVDFIILEDGFQSKHIGRHYDLLIVDQWSVKGQNLVPTDNAVIPWGPYRESIDAIKRADAVLVPENETIDADGYIVDQKTYLYTRESELTNAVLESYSKYLIISGIARPEQFESSCINLIGHGPEMAYRFDDHISYSQNVMAEIFAKCEAENLTLITTAKDFVKLSPMLPITVNCVIPEVRIKWKNESPITQIINQLKGQNVINN